MPPTIIIRCPYPACGSDLVVSGDGWWHCPQCDGAFLVRLRERAVVSTGGDDAAWEYPRPLALPLAEFNPNHDALGRFATGPGSMAPDTGGGGGDGGAKPKTWEDVSSAETGKIWSDKMYGKNKLSANQQEWVASALAQLPAWTTHCVERVNCAQKPINFETSSGKKCVGAGSWKKANRTLYVYQEGARSEAHVERVMTHEVGHSIWDGLTGRGAESSAKGLGVQPPEVTKSIAAFKRAYKAGDGVTKYSQSWKDQITETFAEMTRFRYSKKGGQSLDPFIDAPATRKVKAAYDDMMNKIDAWQGKRVVE